MTAKYRASISFLAALAAAMAAAMPAFPQEQHTAELSKVVRLNRAPVSNETLQVTLPKPVVTKLPNGLTVLVLERHKLPTVNIVLQFGTGDMSDPKDLPGLAGFTIEMLREGTTHRTSAQLAADVDKIGATLNCIFGIWFHRFQCRRIGPFPQHRPNSGFDQRYRAESHLPRRRTGEIQGTATFAA